MPRIRSENSKIKYRYRNERRIILRKNLFALAAWNASRQKESAPKQLLVIAGQRINVVSGLLFLPPMLVCAVCFKIYRLISPAIVAATVREIVAAGEVTGSLKYCKHWENCDARGNGRARSYVSTNFDRTHPGIFESFNAYKLRETLRSSLNNR